MHPLVKFQFLSCNFVFSFLVFIFFFIETILNSNFFWKFLIEKYVLYYKFLEFIIAAGSSVAISKKKKKKVTPEGCTFSSRIWNITRYKEHSMDQ